MSEPKAHDFWGKVEKTETCWLWTRHLTRDGYGAVKTNPGGVQQLAHRYAYKELIGPVPGDLPLDHLCRVKNCVNPDHLEPVTQAENTRRQHASRTHCRRGHELTGDNLLITAGWDGHVRRVCVACRDEKVPCDECGALVSRRGLSQHKRRRHVIAA